MAVGTRQQPEGSRQQPTYLPLSKNFEWALIMLSLYRLLLLQPSAYCFLLSFRKNQRTGS